VKVFRQTCNQWSIGIGIHRSTIYGNWRWHLWVNHGFGSTSISWKKNPNRPQVKEHKRMTTPDPTTQPPVALTEREAFEASFEPDEQARVALRRLREGDTYVQRATFLRCCWHGWQARAAASAPAVAPMTDERIEALALEHEAFGLGRLDKRGLTTHGFDPEGLRNFARALLAAQPPVQVDEALRDAGANLATIAFNLAQRAGSALSEHECKVIKTAQVRWDAALRARLEGTTK
jgi:hypothetical protein